MFCVRIECSKKLVILLMYRKTKEKWIGMTSLFPFPHTNPLSGMTSLLPFAHTNPLSGMSHHESVRYTKLAPKKFHLKSIKIRNLPTNEYCLVHLHIGWNSFYLDSLFLIELTDIFLIILSLQRTTATIENLSYYIA